MNSRMYATHFISLTLVLALLAFGCQTQSDTVSVPNVVGMARSAAESAITSAGLTVGTVTEVASTNVPAGTVMSQVPFAGNSVAVRSTVNLVVSKSATSIAVPNVVGMTRTGAESAITSAGLRVGSVTEAASTSVPVGRVISQSPGAGANVASGSAVNLVISRGSATVSVPNVVGMTRTGAELAIASAGLTVGSVTEAASTSVPAGRVISQSPSAGASVASGSAVNLVISRGAPSITVPNAVGMTRSAAESAITSAGLSVGTVTEAASTSVPAGRVSSQNPGAGAIVAPGSRVDLVVSRGSEPTKEIQGVVFYGPVSGATVRVDSLANETVLDTVETDEVGRFAVELPTAAIEEGFRLQVSGVTIEGEPVTANLSAVYSSAEASQEANVTALTTLVAGVADSGLVQGADSLLRRDAAIEMLVERDLATEATWAHLEPERVQLESIHTQAEDAGSLEAWIEELIAGLQAEELAPDFLAVFPYAHGGILAIHADGNGFPGQPKQIPVRVRSTSVLSEDYVIEVLDAPSGLRLSGEVLEYAIPENAPPGAIQFELAVTHRTSGLGRTVTNIIDVLAAEVLGEALIGSAGGTVTDLWDEFAVNVPAGALTEETLVRLAKGYSPDGTPSYTAFAPGAPEPLPASVTLSLPNPNLLAERESESKSLNPDDPGVIRRFNAFFTSGIHLADNRIPDSIDAPAQAHPSPRCAAQLVKYCDLSGQSCDDGREPVIFVHGYKRSISGRQRLGGGEDTWGEFLPRLQAAGFQCYEFQYISSARFQDIATDLAASIGAISAQHGKKVHIIAHSFGGLVARTYMQNLTAPLNAPYADNVASLTTVGTPHSGIFSNCGEYGGRNFPRGKGNSIIEFARQLSTYQAGEPAHLDKKFLDFDSWFLSEQEMLDMYQIDSEPGEIPIQLADFGRNPYPEVPTQVLVGLQKDINLLELYSVIDDTDGLISYSGQRFHPSFSNFVIQCYPTAISMNGIESSPIETIEGNRFSAVLQEKLLGLRDSLKPGDPWPIDGTEWSHTSSNLVRTWGSSHQVEVECAGEDDCGEVFNETKAWLNTWQAGPQVSPAMTIRGRILRAQDFAPVGNVEVNVLHNGVLTDDVAFSNSEGDFDLDTLFYGPGTYTLSVRAVGFHTREHNVNLNLSAANASVYQVGEIYLHSESGGRGSLSGYVTDRFSEQTLSNVSLSITNGQLVIDRETDANGYYFVSDLAAGVWRIYAAAVGYIQTEPVEVVVLPGPSNDGPVALTPDDVSDLELPEVVTLDPDDHGWVGNICARLGGYTENDGGATIADIQLGWGTTSDGSDWEYISGGARSNVDVVLDVLQPGDWYYTRAYARNVAFPEDWGRGDRHSFRTDSRLGLADVTVPLARVSTTQGFREGLNYHVLSGITNLGDETIQHAVCEIYIATDSDWNTSDDRFLDTVEVSNVPPCGTQWVRTDFVMPDLLDRSSGEYQVKFSWKLDANDEVDELSESNEWQSMGWYTAIDTDAKALPVGVPPSYMPDSLDQAANAKPALTVDER